MAIWWWQLKDLFIFTPKLGEGEPNLMTQLFQRGWNKPPTRFGDFVGFEFLDVFYHFRREENPLFIQMIHPRQGGV